MIPTDIAALQGLLERATPGPWIVPGKGYGWDHFAAVTASSGIVANCRIAALSRDHSQTGADAALIVALRNSAAALLAGHAALEARALAAEAQRDRLKEALRNIVDAANSFCDESGDEVASQVKLRARAALATLETPDAN